MEKGEFETSIDSVIRTTDQYYSDLRSNDKSPTEMVNAAGRYIRALGVVTSKDEERALLDNYVTIEASTLRLTDFKDLMSILPFYVAAPMVETNYDVKQMTKWYEKTLDRLVTDMSRIHSSKECLDSPYFAHSSECYYSDFCPVVAVSKHLQEGSLSTVAHPSDRPESDKNLQKLAIGVQYGFIEPYQERWLSESYEERSRKFAQGAMKALALDSPED